MLLNDNGKWFSWCSTIPLKLSVQDRNTKYCNTSSPDLFIYLTSFLWIVVNSPGKHFMACKSSGCPAQRSL